MKPILFNTEMVKAILEGRKTQTRRLPNSRIRDMWYSWDEYQCAVAPPGSILATEKGFYEKHQPYEQGDVLWVRETWNYGFVESCDREFSNEVWFEPSDRKTEGSYLRSVSRFWYYADENDRKDMQELQGFWKPSIHMPRDAARIFLRVTNVRCERLQDITNNDAKAEGITCATDNSGMMHRHKFRQLWDSITPPECQWDANPWVWVITFERCTEYEANL